MITYGDPTVPTRIWKRIRVDVDGCWIWTGTLVNGYGITSHEGKRVFVHRLMYRAEHGEFPNATHHRCFKKACCRPACLLNTTKAWNSHLGPHRGKDKKPRKRTRHTTTVTFNIPRRTYERLRTVGAAERMSIGSMGRQAIEFWLHGKA